jgi:hypothetical protein
MSNWAFEASIKIKSKRLPRRPKILVSHPFLLVEAEPKITQRMDDIIQHQLAFLWVVTHQVKVI